MEMTPVVDASLSEVGAVQSYDQIMERYEDLPFAPPVDADLTAYVVDKGMSQSNPEEMSGVFYSRGIVISAILAEGIAAAQAEFGTAEITAKLGETVVAGRFTISAIDHNGWARSFGNGRDRMHDVVNTKQGGVVVDDQNSLLGHTCLRRRPAGGAQQIGRSRARTRSLLPPRNRPPH